MDDGTTALGAGFEVTITRTFNAPADLVFDCFVNPERLAKWWGPLACENVIYTLDARPGGEISLQMAGPGYRHTMGGEFVEIDRPRRLVFRSKAFEAPDGGWGIINLNTITFEPVCDATSVTVHTLVERAQGDLVLGALGGMKIGWGQSLEKLGDLVGGGKMDVEVGDRTLVLRRAFDADPYRIWAALTQPDLFVRWWVGAGDVQAMDVRPGGQWVIVTKGAVGSEHRLWGRYLEVEAPVRLAMTQRFDSHPEIDVLNTLAEEWGRTTLTRTMTFPDNDHRDAVINSGIEIEAADSYDRLAQVTAV